MNNGDPKEKLRRLLTSLFVQDTLIPVVGGKLPPVGFKELGRRTFPQRKAQLRIDPEKSDTTITIFTPGLKDLEESLTHESGHLLRLRLGPDDPIVRAVTDSFPKVRKGRHRVAGMNPSEHFAEAFRDAMESVRKGRKKTSIPGAEILREFILNALKTQEEDE